MLTALTTALLLGSLFQDAEPAAPAPAHDPKAMVIVDEFTDMLYSPKADGLQTLAFDMILPAGPMGGSLGTLSVTWNMKSGADGSFAMADAMKEQIPEAMRAGMMEQLNAQMGAMAGQIAAIQTNQVMQDALDGRTAALAGVEEGFVKVECAALPGSEGGDRTLYFEDGLLVQTKQMVAGQFGESESVGVMRWVPIAKDSELLVLGSTDETSSGMTQSSSFVRERVGGFLLVTAIEAEAMGQAQKMTFTNFVVNGKPAALKAEATPDARDTMGEMEAGEPSEG